MTTTVDTKVLVYASDTDAAEQPRAEALLRHLAAGPDLVVVMWPTLMGYLRIVTHPSICRSPLPVEAARANVDGLLALPHIRAPGETAEFRQACGQVGAAVHPRGHLSTARHR